MKRIDFIKRLFLSFFGAAYVKPAAVAAVNSVTGKLVYTLSATVAGVQYYDFRKVISKLDADLVVNERTGNFEYPEHLAELRLEPDNPHDFRAIEVYCSGFKMGYIPRKDNKVLYNLLKDGKELVAYVRLDSFDIPPYLDLPDEEHLLAMHELRIRVYLKA